MKERITITIDDDLLAWIDNQVASKRFATRSHALESLMLGAKRKAVVHYVQIGGSVR